MTSLTVKEECKLVSIALHQRGDYVAYLDLRVAHNAKCPFPSPYRAVASSIRRQTHLIEYSKYSPLLKNNSEAVMVKGGDDDNVITITDTKGDNPRKYNVKQGGSRPDDESSFAPLASSQQRPIHHRAPRPCQSPALPTSFREYARSTPSLFALAVRVIFLPRPFETRHFASSRFWVVLCDSDAISSVPTTGKVQPRRGALEVV